MSARAEAVAGPSAPAWLLERFGVGALMVWFLLRVVLPTLSSPGSEPGLNLFVGSVAWLGIAAYLLARALGGGWQFSRTGLEIPLLVWAVLLLVSPWRAVSRDMPGYPLTAVEGAFGFVTMIAAIVFIADQCASGYRDAWVRVFLGATAVALAYGLFQSLWAFPRLASMTWEEAARRVGAENAEEFLMRVRDAEPFGTFLLSNTLAGFLAMVLPFLAGRIWDAVRSGRRAIAEIAMILAGLFLLWRTGSRGGIAAAGAALMAFAVLARERTRGGTPGRVLLAGAAVGVLVGIVLGPLGGWRWLTVHVETMGYRKVYAQAALGMARKSPWFGVGLFQYGEHYPRFRGSSLEETRAVHNDYLQFFAETGVFGAAAFLAVLYAMLARGLEWIREAPAVSEPRSDARAPPWLGAALAGMVAVGLAYLAGGAFNDIGGTPALALLMYAVFVLAAVACPARDGPYSGLGWTAGLVGYLVHATVDFDLYTFGFAAAFATVAAIQLSVRPVDVLPVPRRAVGALAAASLALTAGLFGVWIPKWVAVDQSVRRAREVLEKPAPSLDELSAAIGQMLEALNANPLDARSVQVLAELYWARWNARAGRPGVILPDLEASEQDLESASIVLFHQGKRRRPSSAAVDWAMGYTDMLQYELRRRLAREGADAARVRESWQRAAQAAASAVSRFEAAVAADPNLPVYRYWLARAHWAMAESQPAAAETHREAARRQYDRAVRAAARARLRRIAEYWKPDPKDVLAEYFGGR